MPTRLAPDAATRYRYLGDRYTRPELRGVFCTAVKQGGKCIRGRKGSMLVCFDTGEWCVVTGRLLRKVAA